MKIEILGVHPVESEVPCHLIEIVVEGHGEALDLIKLTQRNETLDRRHWQVPYDECLLSEDGTAAEEYARSPIELQGRLRLAFFFHCLDLDRPLETPIGEVRLPPSATRPERLSFIQYYEPT